MHICLCVSIILGNDFYRSLIKYITYEKNPYAIAIVR